MASLLVTGLFPVEPRQTVLHYGGSVISDPEKIIGLSTGQVIGGTIQVKKVDEIIGNLIR